MPACKREIMVIIRRKTLTLAVGQMLCRKTILAAVAGKKSGRLENKPEKNHEIRYLKELFFLLTRYRKRSRV